MFFMTIFLMDGPKKPVEPKDVGHENGICTTADEMSLPTITNGKLNGNRLNTEISRL